MDIKCELWFRILLIIIVIDHDPFRQGRSQKNTLGD